MSRFQCKRKPFAAYPFFSCSICNLPAFADPKQAKEVRKLIREDLDNIIAALVTLDEMQSPLLSAECAFMNANILVMSYEITDDVSAAGLEGENHRERKLYRMYNLKTNTRIPIKDAIPFSKLALPALLEGVPACSLLEQYIHLEDPLWELGARNNPMSVFLTQEGLCLLTCEDSESPDPVYQRTLRLIPREYLLDMEISRWWDDVPGRSKDE